MRIVASIFAVWLVAGCAAESYVRSVEQMRAGTSAVITTDRGLAFGEKCGGGGFTFESTDGLRTSYVPGWDTEQRFFFISLPGGEYTLAGIGSTDGPFLGEPPLRFHVVPGKAVYIGSVFPTWYRNINPSVCTSQLSRAVKQRTHMRPVLVNQDRYRVPVYILDQPDVAVRALKHEYPKVDLTGHVTRLLE